MKKSLLLFVTMASMLSTPTAFAKSSIANAIKAGEVHLDFRLRYENVDQDNAANLKADAITLRSRLNYKTAVWQGVTAFVEMDNVSAIDQSGYNSTINGQVGKATIADPVGTEVNQVWLNYFNWNTQFKYGRQRINLDNQRFVGGVGFRQNEQTYDAFSVTNTGIKDTTIFYAKVNNINRIFGEEHAGGNHSSDTDLLNVKYSGLSVGTVSAYAYLIDNDDAVAASTDTYGVRFAGKASASDIQFNYTLEYAQQEDANKNPLNYKADYWLAEGSAALFGVKATLGYELLASDKGMVAFATPLATLHKFQGWSDQFLATPKEGIADIYFSVGGNVEDVKLLAVYHDFSSDKKNTLGDDDLGSELGLLVAKRFAGFDSGSYGLSLKYARYDAGDSSFGKSDADKLWLTATAKF